MKKHDNKIVFKEQFTEEQILPKYIQLIRDMNIAKEKNEKIVNIILKK